jgi:ribosomal-protein-alanine N-acetyltransferase
MEDEDFKRKGLMTEAVGAIIDFGFGKLHLNRIEALVGAENTASLRLMEKFNFVQEGVLRQHYFTGDKFEDSVVFARLSYPQLSGWEEVPPTF